MAMLDRDEYVEQAFFFEAAVERLKKGEPMQELLSGMRDEVLSTTRLPMALDYMLAELNHAGTMSSAMRKLTHYFTTFQAYIIGESEDDRGKFDIRTAFQLLHCEAKYRATQPSPVGMFFFHFESLCRNRLRYDFGLAAVAQDPIYDKRWAKWIMETRRKIETIGIADLVYVASEYYLERQSRRGLEDLPMPEEVLFAAKEGKIALANRAKEPLRLFEALQRQLNYPAVPRAVAQHDPLEQLTQLMRRIERMEVRMKMMEEEQREGSIDLSKFYRPPEQR